MSAPTTTNAVSSYPKRSWRRFTLRALFLVVLAAAVFCGWVAYHARLLQSRYEWVQKRYAKDFNGPTFKPVENEWFWSPFVGDAAVTIKRAVLSEYSADEQKYELTPEDVEQLRTFTGIEQLHLGGSAITDESIQFIRRSPGLTTLDLQNTAITDRGTRHLVGLTQLQALGIWTSPDRIIVDGALITDKSLKNLVVGKDLRVLGLTAPISDNGLSVIVENCPRLTRLQLFGPRITGNGLRLIARLNNLVELRISDTDLIDDRAIGKLQGPNQLELVWLEQTRVTEQGARAVLDAIPGARVRVQNDQDFREFRLK